MTIAGVITLIVLCPTQRHTRHIFTPKLSVLKTVVRKYWVSPIRLSRNINAKNHLEEHDNLF